MLQLRYTHDTSETSTTERTKQLSVGQLKTGDVPL